MRFERLLFDLDGTITDPKEGITRCVQYALKAFEIEEPDLDRLTPFIRPPLQQSFQEFYGMDAPQAKQAVEEYRKRFSTVGLYENVIYPGMAQMLEQLCEQGCHLAVASSKPTVFVRKILEHFQIDRFFEVVVGSELNGSRVEKEEVVAEALRQLEQLGEAAGSTAMIGDRRFDIEGAKAHGLTSIGVAYGYALPGELEAAGADFIVPDVAALSALLLG